MKLIAQSDGAIETEKGVSRSGQSWDGVRGQLGAQRYDQVVELNLASAGFNPTSAHVDPLHRGDNQLHVAGKQAS
jgi:hypothetical protein